MYLSDFNDRCRAPYLDLIAVCDELVRLTDAQMLVEEDGLSIWGDSCTLDIYARQEDCKMVVECGLSSGIRPMTACFFSASYVLLLELLHPGDVVLPDEEASYACVG